MTKKDELSMWAQYGDGGAGCCLGFNASTIEHELYPVSYNPKKVQEFFHRLCRILCDFIELEPNIDIEHSAVFKYAAESIRQISYLYKDKPYSYEKEVNRPK